MKARGKQNQRVSSISSSSIFLACNFGNRHVKTHFNSLKRKWESTLPVRVYISDQIVGGGARDLWMDIKQAIREANLAIFDTTSIRPNVALELGYALACKDTNRICICRDLTPNGRRGPGKWPISDIGHLIRIEYRSFKTLDDELLRHVEAMAPVKKFYLLLGEIKKREPHDAAAYVGEALHILIALRDNGPISRRDFKACIIDDTVSSVKLGNLLKRYKLAKPPVGTNGRWKLID